MIGQGFFKVNMLSVSPVRNPRTCRACTMLINGFFSSGPAIIIKGQTEVIIRTRQ